MFDTVLVANRGEIAVRIIRTLRHLGIRSVVVYSDADANALHVELADSAVRLGPAPAYQSYLAVDRILDACHLSGAQAVHPGYGFLSENADFARACSSAGVVFIGPPPEVIEAMGDKIRAKRIARSAGVPIVPGVQWSGMTDAELIEAAVGVGYPLLVKPVAGGGGKGIRVVREPAGLPEALAAARREVKGAFGDDTLLLERFLERPRHIEIQVLADQHGTIVHLGERECSLQRRYQKIVEECPSPGLDNTTWERLSAAAVSMTRACNYVGAGTVEFLVSGREFYFLEMNTRLQVEHPVTEFVYRTDLVEQQLRIAAGERLELDLHPWGHAIEARVYAEDPARGFLPNSGVILEYVEPLLRGRGRIDAGIRVGSVVGSDYDPLLAKVIAYGPDREIVLRRLDGVLGELVVLGVGTNTPFLRRLLADPDVQAGHLDTGLIERRIDALVEDYPPDDVFIAAVMARVLALEPSRNVPVDPFDLPGGWRMTGELAWMRWRMRAGQTGPVDVRVRGRAAAAEVTVGQGAARPVSARWDVGELTDDLMVTLDGETRRYVYVKDGDVAWLSRDGGSWALWEEDALVVACRPDETGDGGPLTAPVPGTVTMLQAAVGDQVTAGQTLLFVEAMKMEHPITAPIDGVVTALHVAEGQQVGIDELLAVVEAQSPDDGGPGMRPIGRAAVDLA
jgi:acetyl-CoA/propionyl-CoA carboxylase, biotin carboxylase, biotin carboxyl carrier protein